MKIALLVLASILGIWYNYRAARNWWAVQRTHLPKILDLGGWLTVGLSGIWYVFAFVFFLGLTLNNTVFR